MTTEPRQPGKGNELERAIGIFTTDVRLVITNWDATLAAITGIAANEAVGRTLTDLVPDLESRGLIARFEQVLASGAPQVLASALHGYLIPCPPRVSSSRFDRMRQCVAIAPLGDERPPLGLVVTVEDVTARVERESSLASEAQEIRAALGHQDWRMRRTAVDALTARRDPALVQALIQVLRECHRDFNVLSSALQLLTASDVDLTASLAELIRDDDPDLRMQAALALGHQRGPDAVAALIRALDDPDANVRFHAVEALGRLGAVSAVDRLADIAESGDFFLAFPALDALARIEDPSAAHRITALLGDDLLRGAAAEALGRIADESAIDPLVGTLGRPGAPVLSVTGALSAIHARAARKFGTGVHIEERVHQSITPSAVERLIEAASDAAGPELRDLIVVLGWLRGDAVERALTRLLGTAGVEHEIIEAVVRFGPSIVDRLIDQLDRADLDARRAAVTALGRIGDVRATPALLRVLDAGDRELFVPVLNALAHSGDRLAFEPLVALLGDEDVAVRQSAIGALNSIGHPDMPARIRELLEDDDPRVRESAARIAGYFGYPDCAEPLTARCHDADERVRAAALEHIAFIDAGSVVRVLSEALADEKPRIRAAAAKALGHVESPEARAALRTSAAYDADSWVRYFSIVSIGRQRDQDARTVLETLMGADQPAHVRIAAIEALRTLDVDGAEHAIRAAASDPEPDVAAAALRALGFLGGKASAETLRAALSSTDPQLRAAAIEGIARLGDADAIERLRWVAAAEADAGVARAALDGLRTLASRPGRDGADAVRALTELAALPERRSEAIAALAQLPASAIPAVGERLSAGDPRVRSAVVDALGRRAHPSASAYVIAALDDSDPRVRVDAIAVLSALGTRGLAQRFATMVRSDTAASVRRAAAAALSRSGASPGGAVQTDLVVERDADS